jgi:heparanase
VKPLRYRRRVLTGAVALSLVASLADCHEKTAGSLALHPDRMPRVGAVDERYQSYNIEMVEVTGGRFWKPYPPPGAAVSSDRYQYRSPIDLSNPRLRKLAAALGPAYVRVSGTWANSTYLADSDDAPSAPPAGYGGVLTHRQWKGVIDFGKAVDANIVTSFAVSAGTRDSSGVWTPQEAQRVIAFTRAAGGRIAAAELMNEPTLPSIGAVLAGYDAAAYGRDFSVFRKFAQESAPDMLILGPGSTGEADDDTSAKPNNLKTRDLLKATGPGGVNVFSYHHYGAVSERCDGPRKADGALAEDWLARTDHTFRFYQQVRDELEPGKPLWVTETAEAACGGNTWAATFIDTFRYLDQLGRLARQGVRVVAHNTLAASDYGLLDERDFAPRPNYWGALLWRRLMGATVLDSGIPIAEGQHVYAHCLRDVPGGVALLVINNDRASPRTLAVGTSGLRYTLSATPLQSRAVSLNALELRMGADGELPPLTGVKFPAGTLTLEPATITFLALPDAGNQGCRQ